MRMSSPLGAASAWTTLGLQWLEMISASAQVVSHRTSRANTPAQLFDMGAEKARAAVESSHAMTRRMMTFPSSDPFAMWGAWARMLSVGATPYRARAVRNAKAARRK